MVGLVVVGGVGGNFGGGWWWLVVVLVGVSGGFGGGWSRVFCKPHSFVFVKYSCHILEIHSFQ